MSKLEACKDCGKEISKKAKSCPQCGAERKSGSIGKGAGCLVIIAVIAIVGFLAPPDTANTKASVGQVSGSAPQPEPKQFSVWATSDVNLRAGAGTKFEKVGLLKKRERLSCTSIDGDWLECAGGKYVKRSWVTTERPGRFEIDSWTFRSDRDFGGDGAVIWEGIVRNHSSGYVDSVRVEFTSFDEAGGLITTDVGYASGLKPGGTAIVKGYATYFGSEFRGSLRIVDR